MHEALNPCIAFPLMPLIHLLLTVIHVTLYLLLTYCILILRGKRLQIV